MSVRRQLLPRVVFPVHPSTTLPLPSDALTRINPYGVTRTLLQATAATLYDYCRTCYSKPTTLRTNTAYSFSTTAVFFQPFGIRGLETSPPIRSSDGASLRILTKHQHLGNMVRPLSPRAQSMCRTHPVSRIAFAGLFTGQEIGFVLRGRVGSGRVRISVYRPLSYQVTCIVINGKNDVYACIYSLYRKYVPHGRISIPKVKKKP